MHASVTSRQTLTTQCHIHFFQQNCGQITHVPELGNLLVCREL
jgi:hypothetical protein